jgi:hypothetical protein
MGELIGGDPYRVPTPDEINAAIVQQAYENGIDLRPTNANVANLGLLPMGSGPNDGPSNFPDIFGAIDEARAAQAQAQSITAASSGGFAPLDSSLPADVASGAGSAPMVLASRFMDGAFYSAVNMVWQPAAQTLDLGQAGIGLLTDGKYEPYWLSGISSNYAAGMSYGETITRAALGSNPVSGIGLFSYDMTNSAMQGDWGGVAEGLGGMVGSYGLVKAGQSYFAPEPGAQLGIYRVQPEGGVTDPLVSPGNLLQPLPADQAPNFINPQPVFIADKPLYRVYDNVDAYPNGRWWADKPPPSSEGGWRSGYAVTEDYNAGTMQAAYTPKGLWAWGGEAAPQGITGNFHDFSLIGSTYRIGWIQPGGQFQLFIGNARSLIPSSSGIGHTPWNR